MAFRYSLFLGKLFWQQITDKDADRYKEARHRKPEKTPHIMHKRSTPMKMRNRVC